MIQLLRVARAASLVAALVPYAVAQDAQDDVNEGAAPDELAELRETLETMERNHALDLEDLQLQFEGLEDELGDLRTRALSAQRPNVFNPAITVFGNFLGRMDDRRVYLDDDPGADRIDDQFNLREVELDFRAAIDPWADGVVIAAFESEVPGEFDADIEEGYVSLKKLPFMEEAPAGLKLQVGRFRPGFGRFNQVHLHDLPQITYPRALETFLGEEGYVQNGLAGKFFLPSPSESQTIEASFALLNGGDIPVADDEPSSNLAGLGRLAAFADLGGASSLELGTSIWQSDTDHRLYGADASYKWKPFTGGEWRSFLIGGELFQADLDDPALDDKPMGYYVWSQYQFNKNLYLGLRYDHSQDIDDDSIDTQTLGTYLTYYTTEFLRFRIGFEHTESDDPDLDELDTALFELNFVFGSHPVEPYWVNR